MNVEILNVYSNETEKGSRLKGDHGQSFLISSENDKVLFDTGRKGAILLHNMKELGIAPDVISCMALSHGHFDHTGGLPAFLDARTSPSKLPIYAHPAFNEEKVGKMGIIKMPLGTPKLNAEQEEKMDLRLSKEQQQISNCLFLTGEISERNELDGTEPNAMHRENGKLVKDPLMDDLSLVLKSKDGIVIIAGCAHSGILNICEFVKSKMQDKITTIIGGTHMVRYTEEEVLHVAEQLKSKYDYPDLYLNHCTDKLPIPFAKKTKAFDILLDIYGEKKVSKCFVGTRYSFECN